MKPTSILLTVIFFIVAGSNCFAEPSQKKPLTHTLSHSCQQPTLAELDKLVWIEGGTFTFGSDAGYKDEAKAANTSVKGFGLARTK